MIIPIFHCFDDRYAAPAAVAFLSMLEHADPQHDYRLYVAHEDITPAHQKMLHAVVGRFKNAQLEFFVPKLNAGDMWSGVDYKSHYAKEILYKLVVSDLFPQYERMIVTDVDCLYEDDVSREFVSFLNDQTAYLAGIGANDGFQCPQLDKFFDLSYGRRFTTAERQLIRQGVGAGYIIFNLELLRRDGISRKLLQCFQENASRLEQPEQDVINLVCAGRIKKLGMRNMVCTYLWDWLDSAELSRLKPIIDKPVQLHFATRRKPWNKLDCSHSHLWWGYLARTPFFYEVMTSIQQSRRMSLRLRLSRIRTCAVLYRAFVKVQGFFTRLLH